MRGGRFTLFPVLLGLALVALLAQMTTSCSLVSVRLNQMQVIGTHNSFHIEPSAAKLAAMMQVDPTAELLAYSHPPLQQQFENEGVRQIELDVFADPAGGQWRPFGRRGFKVFHIESIDMDSTCEVLVDCLNAVKTWSDAHRSHLPITILIEPKDSADVPGAPDPVPLTAALFRDLDTELRSVFPPQQLITPDDVRGSHSTLEQAVLTSGWPRIDAVRGRVMFVLDGRRTEYLDGDSSLRGRVIFTPSTPGQADAAFIKRNDPTGANLAQIADLVRRGYIVRTRADDPVATAKSGSTVQRDAALASGAQWVSTDYPVSGMSTRWGTSYVARIPGGTPAGCNPVNAPPGCTSTLVENLAP